MAHDDDIPLKPLSGDWRLRHHEPPISLSEHLHKSLDSLLAEMERTQETLGMVGIQILDIDGPWAGRNILLAVDLDPHDCEGCPGCQRDEGGEA